MTPKLKSQVHNIAHKLVAELNDLWVECYIWHEAQGGSVYIRFKNQFIGSIRISDHPERSKLKYKFNIRADVHHNHNKWVKDKGSWRFTVSLNRWRNVIPEVLNRHHIVKEWTFKPKYNYIIPYYKLKKMKKDLHTS